MGKVLRVLNGRHTGAVFVLRGRTTIGRAGHVDIQLVNDTVSRQHAKLTVDQHGEVVLTDLSSDNGTFVNGEPIARRVLGVGDTICVGDTRFVLEDVPDDPSVRTSPELGGRSTSTESLRQTAPHRIVMPVAQASAAAPAGPRRATPAGTSGEYRHVRRATPTRSEPRASAPHRLADASRVSAEARESIGDSEDPTPISLNPPLRHATDDAAVRARAEAPTRPEPGASPRPRSMAESAADDTAAAAQGSVSSRFEREGQGLGFRRRTTAEYGASWEEANVSGVSTAPEPFFGEDALFDVLAYRHLRLRTLRSDPLDAHERARFLALERRLECEAGEADDLALQRRFRRFPCALPVGVRVDPSDRGRHHPARMLDLSAGGAQLKVEKAPIDEGDTVWLAIDLRGLARGEQQAVALREVVLESRVIWLRADNGRVGVIFVGEALARESLV